MKDTMEVKDCCQIPDNRELVGSLPGGETSSTGPIEVKRCRVCGVFLRTQCWNMSSTPQGCGIRLREACPEEIEHVQFSDKKRQILWSAFKGLVDELSLQQLDEILAKLVE